MPINGRWVQARKACTLNFLNQRFRLLLLNYAARRVPLLTR